MLYPRRRSAGTIAMAVGETVHATSVRPMGKSSRPPRPITLGASSPPSALLQPPPPSFCRACGGATFPHSYQNAIFQSRTSWYSTRCTNCNACVRLHLVQSLYLPLLLNPHLFPIGNKDNSTAVYTARAPFSPGCMLRCLSHLLFLTPCPLKFQSTRTYIFPGSLFRRRARALALMP